MTVDQQNSVYVGGLPYECSESQLRRYFQPYGSVISVKIIIEGTKCYGFVSFANPRSVNDAIREMDGKTIGNRVVRVNEVTTRGRFDYGHHNERDRDRGRGRQDDHDKDRHRDHSRENDGKRERGYGRSHDRDVDHPSDHFHGRDRGQSREMEDHEGYNRNCGWERGRDDDLIIARDRQVDDFDDDRRGDKNLDRHVHRKNRSTSYERQSREHSSESSDYYRQVEEQLQLLIQRRDELQKEKSDMERTLEEKKLSIVSLQKRSMKLEDGLTSAKRLTSKRQMQLTKLCNSFEQVKEYAERLKGSEKELKDLVNSVSMEIDTDGDLNTRGPSHVKGF